jgi:hypothetical protein
MSSLPRRNLTLNKGYLRPPTELLHCARAKAVAREAQIQHKRLRANLLARADECVTTKRKFPPRARFASSLLKTLLLMLRRKTPATPRLPLKYHLSACFVPLLNSQRPLPFPAAALCRHNGNNAAFVGHIISTLGPFSCASTRLAATCACVCASPLRHRCLIYFGHRYARREERAERSNLIKNL